MKNILLILILLSIHMSAEADWSVITRIDSMTDETKKSAIVKNKDGHSFSIYRLSEGGEVWGNFALSDGKFEQVDWRKPPIYRVDKNKALDLSILKGLNELENEFGSGKKYYEWEPKWVNFRLWEGKEKSGGFKYIAQIASGKKITFRYYLSTGGSKETTFLLNNSSDSISKAINVNTSKIDHSSLKNEEKWRKLFVSESKKCYRSANKSSCRSLIMNCAKDSEKDYNINKFKACIQK